MTLPNGVAWVPALGGIIGEQAMQLRIYSMPSRMTARVNACGHGVKYLDASSAVAGIVLAHDAH
jgi:hypothetical protein